MTNRVMLQYESIPYGVPTISEEEFVYDSLRNRFLFSILKEGTSGIIFGSCLEKRLHNSNITSVFTVYVKNDFEDDDDPEPETKDNKK